LLLGVIPTRGPSGRVAVTLLFSLCAVLYACQTGEASGLRFGPGELVHAGVITFDLAAQSASGTPELGIPIDIAIAGRYLAVIDLAADSVLHLFDRTTGEPVGRFGRRGGGPGEFRAPWSMQATDGDPARVWVYDIRLRRLTLVDIGASVEAGELVVARSLTLSTNGIPTGPLWIDSAAAVSLGFFGRGRIAVFDAAGNHTATYGSLPLDSLELAPAVQQHVYQATATLDPSAQLLAAVTRHASQLEIYGARGTTLASVSGPLRVEPRYTVATSAAGSSMQTGADLRFGYVDVTASDGAIFALFSGRTREAFPRSAYQASFIHVFDWKGRFRYALRLDSPAAAIAVNQSGSMLYAVRHEPTPAVVSYHLGELGDEVVDQP
jgi:hypothetical protein